jgi:hypothetical protein
VIQSVRLPRAPGDAIARIALLVAPIFAADPTAAERLAAPSPLPRGVAFVSGDAALALDLARRGGWLVVAIEADPARAARCCST